MRWMAKNNSPGRNEDGKGKNNYQSVLTCLPTGRSVYFCGLSFNTENTEFFLSQSYTENFCEIGVTCLPTGVFVAKKKCASNQSVIIRGSSLPTGRSVAFLSTKRTQSFTLFLVVFCKNLCHISNHPYLCRPKFGADRVPGFGSSSKNRLSEEVR